VIPWEVIGWEIKSFQAMHRQFRIITAVPFQVPVVNMARRVEVRLKGMAEEIFPGEIAIDTAMNSIPFLESMME